MFQIVLGYKNRLLLDCSLDHWIPQPRLDLTTFNHPMFAAGISNMSSNIWEERPCVHYKRYESNISTAQISHTKFTRIFISFVNFLIFFLVDEAIVKLFRYCQKSTRCQIIQKDKKTPCLKYSLWYLVLSNLLLRIPHDSRNEN